MTIRHHLSDQLLMAYSAGTLPEAFNLVVATHVSLCDECRARLMSFDAVGGALIEDEAADLADALGRCDHGADHGAAAGRRPVRAPRAPKGVLPAPLRDYVGGDLADGEVAEHRRWACGRRSCRRRAMPRRGFCYIPGGSGRARPRSPGDGADAGAAGRVPRREDRFGPGDIEIATEDLEHTPVAEAGADCICLAATDAPLRFNKLIPRMAQPFFRI